MVIAYIKEERLNNSFFQNFQGMEIGIADNNYIIAIHDKDKKSIQKRLVKKIYKQKIDAIVFSKELEGKFKDDICEMLKLDDNINVKMINGKKLMEYMEFDIMKYILEKQKHSMRQEDIYIIFKRDNSLNLNFLVRFIENFRMTNIVTNDIARLKNVQDNLLDNENILISVSNNKKKALRRAKYVLNVNLTTEELAKYNINRNAVIINIRENVKYSNPGFEGINVNYFDINVPDEFDEKFEQMGNNFDLVKLYESILIAENFGEASTEKVYEKIARDEIQVKNVIGINGRISDEELERVGWNKLLINTWQNAKISLIYSKLFKASKKSQKRYKIFFS